MASFPTDPFAHPFAARAGDRRLAGLALTCLVHVVLIGAWLIARAPLPAQPDGPREAIQWIALPALARPPARPPAAHAAAVPALPHLRSAPAVATPPAATVEPAATLSAEPAPPRETVMERARQMAGSVDRALRKENKPYIVAPPDSPQIRMRNGMAKAHDLAPPKLWEAPKVEELVNQTGDGARRTRVVGAMGTYCITERAPTTSIDMLASNGKERFTNCPQHEDTATQQDWRTARD